MDNRFEELAAYVAQFTPEAAEQITYVPAEEIRRTARAITGAKGAALVSYTGLEYTNSGTQNIRAVLILWALTGNLDVPGGKVIKMPDGEFQVNRRMRQESPPSVNPIGKDKYPIYHLYRKEAQCSGTAPGHSPRRSLSPAGNDDCRFVHNHVLSKPLLVAAELCRP